MSLHRRSAGDRSGDPSRCDDHSCTTRGPTGKRLLEGIVGVQKEAVLAARRSIVTVEELVGDLGTRSANAPILPSWTITAVCQVPGGAFPSYAHGYYPRNNGFYLAWDKIARDRKSFTAWMTENVLGKAVDDFKQHAPASRPTLVS